MLRLELQLPGGRWDSIVSGQKVDLEGEVQQTTPSYGKQLRLFPVHMGPSKGFQQGSHTICFITIFKSHYLRVSKLYQFLYVSIL